MDRPNIPEDYFKQVVDVPPGAVRRPGERQRAPVPSPPPVELDENELRQCHVFGSFVLWMALITALVWIVWLGIRIVQVSFQR